MVYDKHVQPPESCVSEDIGYRFRAEGLAVSKSVCPCNTSNRPQATICNATTNTSTSNPTQCYKLCCYCRSIFLTLQIVPSTTAAFVFTLQIVLPTTGAFVLTLQIVPPTIGPFNLTLQIVPPTTGAFALTL